MYGVKSVLCEQLHSAKCTLNLYKNKLKVLSEQLGDRDKCDLRTQTAYNECAQTVNRLRGCKKQLTDKLKLWNKNRAPSLAKD
jgi:hypothetical protein